MRKVFPLQISATLCDAVLRLTSTRIALQVSEKNTSNWVLLVLRSALQPCGGTGHSRSKLRPCWAVYTQNAVWLRLENVETMWVQRAIGVAMKQILTLAACVALSLILSLAFLDGRADAAALNLGLTKSDTLNVGTGSHQITITADGAWSTTQTAAGTTYAYSGPIRIGDFSIGTVDALIGPDGGKLVTSVGFAFGDLSLTAGEMALELLPGDQITDGPDLATFGPDDLVLFAETETSVAISIGDKTSFAVPTPMDADIKLLLEFKNGTFYIEGPVPTPVALANGASAFVKTVAKSSSKGNVVTGGFGYSVDGAFSFASDIALYTASGKEPAAESFSANVVLVGIFDLADMVRIDGQLMVNTETGKVGVNGAGGFGFDLAGDDASVTVGAGSFVVDGKGLRFGFDMQSVTSFLLPPAADNIGQFLLPMVGASAQVAGYAVTAGDYGYSFAANNLNLFGIEHLDLSYSLGPESLSVSETIRLDGLGAVGATGVVSSNSCYLQIDKLRFLGFDLSSPRIKPCDMAKGALSFTGNMELLGQTIAISGVTEAAKAAGAFLDKDHTVTGTVAIKEKLGVSGGLSGGYVKLAATGTVTATLAKTGTLSAALNLSSSARFCGKVSVAGKKLSKCKKTSAGINPNFDVSIGCFNFSGSSDILGTSISISGGKVCPFPASGSYSANAAYDANDALTAGDEGGAIALRASNGAYVSWPSDYNILNVTTTTVSDQIGFSMINMDEAGQCPTDGTNVVLRLGDHGTLGADQYVKQKDKGSAITGTSTDYNDGTKAEKRFYIRGVRMSGGCLADGDVIRLENKEYHQYWTIEGDHVEGHGDDSNNATQRYTVVFDPEWN